MKRIPLTVGMMIFGLYLEILAAANSWGWLMTLSSLIIFAGFIWFSLIWDKLPKIKRRFQEIERVMKSAKDRQDENAMIARAASRKAGEAKEQAKKAASQRIMGRQVTLIDRRRPKKEETA